jgi:cold shock CspA family protein
MIELTEKKGTIIHFNAVHGYGFLVERSGEEEVFFHMKGVLNAKKEDIRVGQKVEYLFCYRSEAIKKTEAIAVMILPTNYEENENEQ